MTLTIDPSKLSDEDIGRERATLEMSHEEAIEHVRESFADAGFGVPVEFSPSELIREKTGSEHQPYYVLGACHPEMADRAMDISPEIGGLMPCNVVIWEEGPDEQQVYHVSIMKIARLLGMAPDDDAWSSLVDDTGDLVQQAFANVRDV
ncbi:DUF302 domain-containing protein [Haloarchaeobius sp. TZWWS8]|uniref:DUF302 domain-containing protein n=1 Tax=Haloarchaeobius sp. TZWWS8 TaxID=3446121 RepID=UPI003EBE36E9